MATKKASSPKKASVKKPVAKAAVVASEATKKAKQITFSEKIVALKPSALIAEFAGTFVLAAIVLNLASAGTIGSVAIALILAILVVFILISIFFIIFIHFGRFSRTNLLWHLDP